MRASSSASCTAADEVAKDGNVYDYDRMMYLRNGMMWQQRATAEGVPLKGNFYWSTMDNFEWINGYGDRFGLVHVDFKTQKRTPKLSASWYREAARRNAVVLVSWIAGRACRETPAQDERVVIPRSFSA